MTTMTEMKRNDERGNALFLILIAVALFAALSYAVTQSGRGSGTITKEQSLISASQITQYPAAVRTAVTRMVITGTAVTAITFDPADTSDDGVFSATGGGSIVQDPPANIGTATVWRYKTAPTTAVGGWFISGIGTGLDEGGRESFAFLDGVSQDVCRSILRGLGLAVAPRDEAVTVDFAGANEGTPTQAGGTAAVGDPEGSNAYSFNIWNTAAPTVDPQAFACVQNNGGNYVYYHALIEQ